MRIALISRERRPRLEPEGRLLPAQPAALAPVVPLVLDDPSSFPLVSEPKQSTAAPLLPPPSESPIRIEDKPVSKGAGSSSGGKKSSTSPAVKKARAATPSKKRPAQAQDMDVDSEALAVREQKESMRTEKDRAYQSLVTQYLGTLESKAEPAAPAVEVPEPKR